MAVVSISKIQIRRGRELQGTGVPQLSSGELGWAVDTQKLYIGNGSTQEGAPATGNTRLLTEHDNIFDLAGQYYYKQLPTAAARTIQDRLEDSVSAADFGAVNDGVTNSTVALQNAIDAVFGVNVSSSSRNILYIPAGVYVISQSLKIPSYAQIQGSGVDNTVIINQNGSVFETVGDVPLAQIDLHTQPRHIRLAHLTAVCNHNSAAILLNSCRDSVFEHLKLTGDWFVPGNTVPVVQTNHAFEMTSLSTVVTNKNNTFENIRIERFNIAVSAVGKIINNRFSNISFYELDQGMVFGQTIANSPAPNGPVQNVIENCDFELIMKSAVQILSGDHNVSRSNRFVNVGNQGGFAPVEPVIDFRTTTNVSVNDYFDRSQLALPNTAGSPLLDQPYVPEVLGRTQFDNQFAVKTTIGQQINWTDFIKLPLIENGTVFIDYVYTVKTANIVREGVLEITINRSTVDPSLNSQLIVSDNYTATGNTVDAARLEFRASFASFNPQTDIDTVLIETINPTVNLTDDDFYYTVKIKS
jgi:hypothetical protein